jgi:hypothetical protein
MRPPMIDADDLSFDTPSLTRLELREARDKMVKEMSESEYLLEIARLNPTPSYSEQVQDSIDACNP